MKIKFFLLCIVCSFQAGYAKQNEENDPARYCLFPYYNNKTNLWGYADSSGKVLIAPQFQEVRHFFYGFAKVKTKGGWSLIDMKGKKAGRDFYDSIAYNQYLLTIDCWTKCRIQTWSIEDGKLVSPKKNEIKMAEEYSIEKEYSIEMPYSKEIVKGNGVVKKKTSIIKLFVPDHSDQWYLGRFEYNTKTEAYERAWMSPDHFDKVGEACEKNNYQFALIKQKGHYGLIGWNGQAEYFIYPTYYDTILFSNFYNSVFFGRKDGKYAIIEASKNSNSNRLTYYHTEPRFEDVKRSSVVNIPVKENNNWYIIYSFNSYTIKQDTLVKNPELSFIDNHVEDIQDGGIGHESYFYYKKNGLWGFACIDYSSKIRKVDAAYSSVKVITDWFSEYDYYYWDKMLLYVTMPDGKKGYVTMKGVKLFE